MLATLKNILKHPTENYEGKKLTGLQSFGYYMILVLIITIPLLITLYQNFSSLSNEYSEITERMPEFTIQDGQFQTEEEAESFVYQGSSYVFYFAPNGEIDQQTIDNNINENNGFLGIGMLEDGVNITFLQDTITIPYSDNILNGLTKNTLINYAEIIRPISMGLILIIIPVVMIYFALYVLLNTLLSYFFTLFMPKSYTFSERFKMSLTSLTWSIIIFAILHLFGLYLVIEFTLVRIIALVLFYYGIRKDPQFKR